MKWTPTMELGTFDEDVQAEVGFAKNELAKAEAAKKQAAQMRTYLLIGAAIVGAVWLIKRRK